MKGAQKCISSSGCKIFGEFSIRREHNFYMLTCSIKDRRRENLSENMSIERSILIPTNKSMQQDLDSHRFKLQSDRIWLRFIKKLIQNQRKYTRFVVRWKFLKSQEHWNQA